MTLPVFCADDLLENVLQYPSHTLTAEEEATGFEVWHVANKRRDSGNAWKPTTANSQSYITCVFDRLRAFDFLAIDRGSTIFGYAVDLLCTVDATDFSGTYETVLDFTLPSLSAPGDVDDGVLTEEGAYVRRFPVRVAKAIRFRIDAMGAGLVPSIVGLHLGLSWQPTRPVEFPWDDDGFDPVAEFMESDRGWVGSTPRTAKRGGTLGFKLDSAAEYDLARYQLTLFGRGHPMWLIHDEEQADKAVLAFNRNRTMLAYQREWWMKRQGEITWEEWEPLP